MTNLPTTPDHRWSCLKTLISAAVRQGESLSVGERADLYDGIALAAASVPQVLDASECAKQAATLATALRESEGLQLHFRNLFSATA